MSQSQKAGRVMENEIAPQALSAAARTGLYVKLRHSHLVLIHASPLTPLPLRLRSLVRQHIPELPVCYSLPPTAQDSLLLYGKWVFYSSPLTTSPAPHLDRRALSLPVAFSINDNLFALRLHASRNKTGSH